MDKEKSVEESKDGCPFCGAPMSGEKNGDIVFECGLVLDPRFNAVVEACEDHDG